ncbi:MAG TPA: hypothetical protein VF498_17340, partial [Anaerolineales bacterium]
MQAGAGQVHRDHRDYGEESFGVRLKKGTVSHNLPSRVSNEGRPLPLAGQLAISSTLSALGGVMLASRLLAVNQSSGGSDLLLNSIAAAVIGGTSL